VRRYPRKANISDDAIRYVGILPGHDRQALDAWCVNTTIGEDGNLRIFVEKSRAWCLVGLGDYVVKEADGSGFYPCSDKDFWRTHDDPNW